MQRSTRATAAASLLALGMTLACAGPAGAAGAAASPDRLERFRALVLGRHELSGEGRRGAYREIYRLLDEEILENLSAGSVFASRAFIQLRLDEMAGISGDTRFAVSEAGEVVVGTFHFFDAAEENSVRVYRRRRGETVLLGRVYGSGRPGVVPLGGTAAGAAQFLVIWEGAPSGTRAPVFRLDVVRAGSGGVVTTWTTAEDYPEGLRARSWSVDDGVFRVRYELHYPGWKPGCPVQTEAEDVWRVDTVGGRLERTARTEYHAWHRMLHAAVDRLVRALDAGDGATVAAMVPDRRVRRALPRRLAVEPACDAPDDPVTPRVVSVAARGNESPWELVWRRSGGTWQLRGAGPVLQ